MKPSIWTTMIWPSSPVEAIETLAGHGWRAFELSCEHIGALARMGDAAVADYAAAVQRLGVDVPQCHATITADVASLDANRRDADLSAVPRDIDICAALGIRNIVIHPGGDAAADRAAWAETTRLRLQSFADLAAHCERVGTRMAIENMCDGGGGVYGKRKFGAVVEDILGLIADIGSPALGVCLDTGHAHVQGLNQPEAIRECGDRLIALHIADNDGSGDQHRCPLYGGVDFPGIIGALREVGTASNFNLEIPGENVAPPEVVALRSRYALGVSEMLLA